MAPLNPAEALAKLRRAQIPAEILWVARRLHEGGHAAVLVGGAVRDVLLDLPAEDWDLATSATPDEIQRAFRRTVPTGIEHGTVTVLVRSADRLRSIGVEVTTFRGEGLYLDGRRPSEVTFHRDLIEDLARRDFTINAFAWDPITETFSDPFAGLVDLDARLVRAVGDPVRRFNEDGLRTMRAVRLCATRSFTLEVATQAAIPGALPILAKVSRERVHVELLKLLAAGRPSQGLRPLAATGMWPYVLPELPVAEREAAIAAVDRIVGDAVVRLARLVYALGKHRGSDRERMLAAIDDLRPSNHERRRIDALASPYALALQIARDPVAVRRAVAAFGREHLDDAIAMLELVPERARSIRDAVAGAALTVGELAVRGGDLVASGVVPKGPLVGVVQRQLLERVVDDPTLNVRERLLELAQSLVRGARP